MAPQTRPLVLFKKEYPERYSILTIDLESSSEKGRENEFYWMYAFSEMNTGQFNDASISEVSSNHRFFYRTTHKRNNIGTITEIGRLLLFCSQNNAFNFAIDTANYVKDIYDNPTSLKDNLRDGKLKLFVKHIRENIGYYYYNEDALNEYKLKFFFNS